MIQKSYYIYNSYLLIVLFFTWSCNSKKSKLVEEAPFISQTYVDDTGREIKLATVPTKIISTAPNITEMIFALDGQNKLAARSQACNYPEEATSYPEITTYPEIDLEQIQSYEADIILTTDEIFSADIINQIARLNIPVFQQSYRSISDIYKGIQNLGLILESEEKANALVDSLQTIENRITSATSEEVQYSSMILISADPFIVVGGTGFLHELLTKAGGKNVFQDKSEPYYTTSIEEILQRSPEILIIPSENEEIYPQLTAQFPMLTQTPADQLKQVYQISSDLVYRPGPRTIEGLLQLTNILHSKLTQDQFVTP